MAFSLGARFSPPPKYYTLLDPGAYQRDKSGTKENAAPFLSRTKRDTGCSKRLYTHAIYFQEIRRRIPNCTSLSSKQPRFPYEAFSAQDLEDILCKCGIIPPCECPTDKEKKPLYVCQGKVKRRIFKGPTPRSATGDGGLSAPSKNDRGFNILADGSQKRMRVKENVETSKFYDARVKEATAIYRGWKWSQWTSKRSQQTSEVRPGPADYFFDRQPTVEEMCQEKVRAFKRKTSRQPRLIELIQRKNLLDNFPGPATYYLSEPKGTDLHFIGCRAERFPISKLIVHPGPADHWIHRDFDPISPPDVPCHAILPKPAGFGSKAKRFKARKEEGPSPATYEVNDKLCQFVNCPSAPFGTSAKRFKEDTIDDSDEETPIILTLNDENAEETCPSPTWEFKSKTVRMKPLVKKQDEPSPADFLPTDIKLGRSAQTQYISPFSSSEGRFRPWYCWIPVHGNLKTPGPASYSLDKPKCPSTFVHGPLYRARRFQTVTNTNPPPNIYNVNNGIEVILATHNHRLKSNINNQYKYIWNQPVDKKSLSFEEREAILLQKSIALLDTEPSTAKSRKERSASKAKVQNIDQPIDETYDSVISPLTKKPKMLRTFLYARPLPKSI